MLVLDSQNRPLRPQLPLEPVQAPRVRGGRRRAVPEPSPDGRYLGAQRSPRRPHTHQDVSQRLVQLGRPATSVDREVGVRLDHLLPGAGSEAPSELRGRREAPLPNWPGSTADRLRTAGQISERVRTLLRADDAGRVPASHLRRAWACARLEQRGLPEVGAQVLRAPKGVDATLASEVSAGNLDRELAQKVRAEVRGLFPREGQGSLRFFDLAEGREARLELSSALDSSRARLTLLA